MTNVSRRSIAKGAAWSVPVVAVGAPAAFAATSCAQVVCADVAAPAVSISGVKSYTSAIGTSSTYDTASAGLAKKGTYVSLSSGMWTFTPPNAAITGYRLSYTDKSHVGITTFSGATSYADLTGLPVQSAQYNPAPAAFALDIQTHVPYTGGIQTPANQIKGISVPFCVTWLVGLTATNASVPGAGCDAGTCCYYINWTFNTPVLWSAGVANSGDAYSVTTTPTYGP